MTTEMQPGPSLASTDRGCPKVIALDAQDQFDGMEEQLHQRVVERLSGAMPTYLPTTDDDLGDDEQTSTQPQKIHLRKFRMADHTVIKHITWSHELIYTTSGQPAIYEELSAMYFVNGYLAVTVVESEENKPLMLADLQELMENGRHMDGTGAGCVVGPCNKPQTQPCRCMAPGGTTLKGTFRIFSTLQTGTSRQQKSEGSWTLQ